MPTPKSLKSQKEIANELKARVTAAVPLLPANYLAIIIKHYPQFNTIKGGRDIDNVRRLRATHSGLTEIFEDIAAGRLTLDGEVMAG